MIATVTSFFMGSRVGRWMAIGALVLVFVLFVVMRIESRGVQRGIDQVMRASREAAEARRKQRHEIDETVRTDGESAADRLRSDWSRD